MAGQNIGVQMLKTVALALLAVVCSSAAAQSVGSVRVSIEGYDIDPNVSDPRSTAGYAKFVNESTGKTTTWNAQAAPVLTVRRYVRMPIVTQDDVDAQRKRENERASILKQIAEATRIGKSGNFFTAFEANKTIKQLTLRLNQLSR